MFALAFIGGAIGLFYGGMPRFVFTGAWVGGMMIAPFSWFMKKHAKFNAQERHPTIFYQDDLSKDDIERIQQIDAIETLGQVMKGKPGYGYHLRDQRHL